MSFDKDMIGVDEAGVDSPWAAQWAAWQRLGRDLRRTGRSLKSVGVKASTKASQLRKFGTEIVSSYNNTANGFRAVGEVGRRTVLTFTEAGKRLRHYPSKG